MKKTGTETKGTKGNKKTASENVEKMEKVEKIKTSKTGSAGKVDKNDSEIATFDKYAIFQTGGKQYQAVEGKTVAIEKIVGEIGDSVEFDKVLLRKSADDKVEVGTPYLKGAIKASIVRQAKGPKILVFKFKRRKKSRVKRGHRQSFTVVRIETI